MLRLFSGRASKSLPADIVQRVEHDFTAPDAASVLARLTALQRAEPKLFSPRILRCIVVAAGGQPARLGELVALARTDYRDLIMAAEYPGFSGERRLDFNLPFSPS